MSARAIALLAGGLVLALLAGACGGVAGSSSGAAATVNGEPIATTTLARIVEGQLEAGNIDPMRLAPEEREAQVGQRQRQLLTALISFELVRQIAEEEGIEVTADDIEERYQQEVEAQGGQQALDQAVAQLGLSDQDFRELVIADLVRQDRLRGQDVDVDEQQLRQLYEQQQAQLTEVEARHILVDGEQDANDIIDRLADGADFAELAEQRSTDTGSAANGGNLGTAPAAQYVPAFREAVLSAEIGEVVGPVSTQFGFHVIEVLERTTPTFEEARAQLEQQVAQQQGQGAFQELISTALADAEVTVASRFGRWDDTSGSVAPSDPIGGDAPPAGTPPPPPAPAPGQTAPAAPPTPLPDASPTATP